MAPDTQETLACNDESNAQGCMCVWCGEGDERCAKGEGWELTNRSVWAVSWLPWVTKGHQLPQVLYFGGQWRQKGPLPVTAQAHMYMVGLDVSDTCWS